jgi:hypothetical protein
VTTLTCQFDGLTSATPHYFRVAAVNGGGESAPSQTLGVAFHTTAPRCLVVSGFTTMSEDLDVTQTAVAGMGSQYAGGGEYVRVWPQIMNAGNYVAQAGDAIAESGRGFESCSAERLRSIKIDPKQYPALVLLFGRQSPADGLLAPIHQAIERYVQQGGNVFVSGANVAAELDDATTRPAPGTREFASRVLGIHFAGDSSGVKNLRGISPEESSTVTLALSDGTKQLYPAESLDELSTASDRVTALFRYSNERQAIAATSKAARDGSGAVVVFGFPFETVTDSNARQMIMDEVLKSFGLAAAKSEAQTRPAQGRRGGRGAGGPRRTR